MWLLLSVLLCFDTSIQQKFQKDIFTVNIKIFLRLILILLFYNPTLHRNPKYFTQIFSLNKPLDRDVYYCQTHSTHTTSNCVAHIFTIPYLYPFPSSLSSIKIALLTGSGGQVFNKDFHSTLSRTPSPSPPPFLQWFHCQKMIFTSIGIRSVGGWSDKDARTLLLYAAARKFVMHL